MFIHWEKSWELGNGLIDTQHRLLILLSRKLDIAIKSNESKECVLRIMLELRKFAEFHFISEENLMHEIGYPDVELHSLMHTELLKRLESMLVKINYQKEFPEDLLHFFSNWVTGHMAEADLKIVNYINRSPQRPVGEQLYKEYLFSNVHSD